MRTVHFRSVAIAVVAFFAAVGTLAAQERSTGLLNSVEVRQLVSRGEPADNARLATHFTALAEQYTAQAKQHVAMSQNFVGNPNRNLGSAMSVHCKQLADLNTQSASTAREVAAYHTKLAGGTAATPPRGGANLQAGAGAPSPSDRELSALAEKASSATDHKAIEDYFVALAKRYTTAADDHTTLAQTYRGTRLAQAAVQQDRLAQLARDAAKEATASADAHKQLAKVAK
jgi:hypothetical protein